MPSKQCTTIPRGMVLCILSYWLLILVLQAILVSILYESGSQDYTLMSPYRPSYVDIILIKVYVLYHGIFYFLNLEAFGLLKEINYYVC